MGKRKRDLFDKRNPPAQDLIPKTIAQSIEQLDIPKIQKLIDEKWLSDGEIKEIIPLLSELGKAKLNQARQ